MLVVLEGMLLARSVFRGIIDFSFPPVVGTKLFVCLKDYS